MLGSPGAGKSMLAQRFGGLLPAMTVAEALENAALHSLVGKFDAAHWGHRSTMAPHHTASAVALVGGGNPPKPGAISLAQNGVLFLDESQVTTPRLVCILSLKGLESCRDPKFV